MGAEELIEDFANDPNTKYPFWELDASRRIIQDYSATGKFQKIHTPFDLCEAILSKLYEYIDVGKCNEIAVLFNLEFVFSAMLHSDVEPEKIWFFSDSEHKSKLARGLGVNVIDIPTLPSLDKGDYKIYQMLLQHNKENAEKFLDFKSKNTKEREINMAKIKEGMKFDVVIMNPPYQPPVNNNGVKGSGSRNTLWDKFVETSFDLVKEGGYIVNVHPSKWRKPLSELYSKLTSRQIEYLEMHSKKDGIKTFGASTPYDWYVLHNIPKKEQTVVVDVKGNQYRFDLSSVPFLPNCDFDVIEKLMAKDGEKKCEVLYSRSEYGGDKDWMSEKKDSKFKYPCIHATPKTKPTRYLYSTRRGAFFDVPKIIFGEADTVQNCVVDIKGEYGITQEAIGLVINSEKMGNQIKKAIESKRFNDLLQQALRWSQFRIDWRLFTFFRKDFWKEFI